MENQSLGVRLKKVWNAFVGRNPTEDYDIRGPGYISRPDRPRFTRGNERSIATSVYNRIALDVATLDFVHCKLDKDKRYSDDMDSGLNKCLTLEANLDQTGRALIQDIVMSMLDEGCVCVVPVETISKTDSMNPYNVWSLRTGKIVEWKPMHVKVRLYNSISGLKQETWFLKSQVAIIENPLYAACNEFNSTLQRLIRKLSLLDVTDEQTASGKLDLIIQLPYSIKTPAAQKRADNRLRSIEEQLSGSRYGIAYADATEKIVQLNRSIENNLMKQVEYLTNLFYSQMGVTQAIMEGTADEKVMANYYSRTIEPFVAAITGEMRRKFLSSTARSQGQTIMAFRDPFKLMPVADVAEISDKFTRNEIMTSNEIRQKIGLKPSKDPKADELVNSNISQSDKSRQGKGVESNEDEQQGL